MQELFYFAVSIFAVGALMGFIAGNIYSRDTPPTIKTENRLDIERIRMGQRREK